jgi:hypothetical protein
MAAVSLPLLIRADEVIERFARPSGFNRALLHCTSQQFCAGDAPVRTAFTIL